MLIGGMILAGGRSRRMGSPKESLPIGDTTLLGRTATVLLDCTFPVVVVARSAEQELPPLPLELELVHDREPGQGPLGGIRAGLEELRGRCDAAFVTGCDAPYLTSQAVNWLADRLRDHDLVIPRCGSFLQPLCAIYRCSVLPVVEELLARGERMPRALVDRLSARVLDDEELRGFDPQLRFLRGVNTREEYEAVLRIEGSGEPS